MIKYIYVSKHIYMYLDCINKHMYNICVYAYTL